MDAAGRKQGWIAAAVAALLALHAVLALTAVREKSVTTDEIFHVTGGYLYDRFGDFRIHPDNGILPQRVHGWAALAAGAKPPSLAGEDWRTSDLQAMSHRFFYDSGQDHAPLLSGARAANLLLFGLGAGLVVFFWARALAGPIAGLAALGLHAFSPTLLAHAPLATSDLAAAGLLPASVGLFWWQLQGGAGRAAISAGVFGLACLAKFSAVLLVPAFLLLAGLHLLRSATPAGAVRRTLVRLLAHGAAAAAIIWAAYGFRYSAFAPDTPPAAHFVRDWDWMLPQLGWQAPVVGLAREWRLLPEGFLFGYTHTFVAAQARSAFLAGDHSVTGWVSFFPLAFLWKSTPAELASLLLAAAVAGWRRRRLTAWWPRLAPLAVWAALYGGAALASHLNIGHRHLLPLYPLLFIGAGVAVARLGVAVRTRAVLAGLLVAGQAVSAAAVRPDYLAYFNTLAGGPANGRHLLVDSSLDWGQDLPALKRWLDAAAGAETVHLAYFGSGRPEYYGIRATALPFFHGFGRIHPYYEPRAGVYAVSATMLQEVYSPVGGNFTPELEREYQTLRALAPVFAAYWRSPEARAAVLATEPESALLRAWVRYDWLRFARLAAYLRAKEPIASAGHSILIYRLDAEEVDRVFNRRYSDWAAAVAGAANR